MESEKDRCRLAQSDRKVNVSQIVEMDTYIMWLSALFQIKKKNKKKTSKNREKDSF